MSKIGFFADKNITPEKLLLNQDFEFVDLSEVLAPDILNRTDVDAVVFETSKFSQFAEFLKNVEWRQYQMNVADTLLFKPNESPRAIYLLPEALLQIIRNKQNDSTANRTVILAGNAEFITGATVKLSMNGFVSVSAVLENYSESEAAVLSQNIKSICFNLDFNVMSIEDLAMCDQLASLFISNISDHLLDTAYEQFSYFNFLQPSSTFIDCNSIFDSRLVEDARRTELKVFDAKDVIVSKSQLLKEITKNSTKA